MISDKRTAWIEQVWTSLRSIPGCTTASLLEVAWRTHQQRQRPVAAIFGAYDAGKSSLLKRLLFEDGASIPDDLTVSGRRETFSVDEADGATWTYRDSPGLAGGNSEHELKALDSLDLADMLIWLLPPQLVTSRKDTFDAIATGARFAVGPEHVAASLMAVISRIDEAGIDAATNPEGFASLCARKQREFASLLATIGAVQPRWGTLPVSADPYQGVENAAPDASIYAMGEGWDGVSELRAALENAANHADELRTLAGFRYASRIIHDLSSAVRNERSEREEALGTIGDERDRLKLLSTSIEALRRSSKADLDRVLEDELLSISRTGTAAAAEVLEKTLGAAIDRWSEQAYGDFEKLAASAEQEVVQRARSPSMKRLKKLLLDLTAPESPATKSGFEDQIKRYGSRVGSSFREGFYAYAKVNLGMSIDDAAKHLREVQESGMTQAAFRAAKGKGKTFSSGDVVKKASEYVRWAKALDALVPLLDQLGPLVFDIAGEVLSKMEADKKAQRRREIHHAIRKEAEGLKTDALTGYDEVNSNFAEWLGEQAKSQASAESVLMAQVVALKASETTMGELMQDRPA